MFIKEQRVDGNYINLYIRDSMLRCTLMYLEINTINSRNFSKLIPKSVITSYYHTFTFSSEKPKVVEPFFWTGFIDGEGSFNLTIYKNSTFKTGWRVKLIFKFALYKRDRGLLELIKYYLKLSNITKHGTQSIQYTVSSMEDLGILFNF